MSLKFIPPKTEKLPRYASYGAGQMKTHASIGAAKQSLTNRCYRYWENVWQEGFILELVNGEWYVRYHVTDGMKDEELPWKKKFFTKFNYGYGSKVEVDKVERPEWYRENGYQERVMSVPETKEDYAAWRVQVELERRGIVE